MIRAPAAKSLKGMWIKNHLSTPHSLRFQQALIVIFGVKRYNYGGYAHFHILYYVLLRSNTYFSIASPLKKDFFERTIVKMILFLRRI